ncbi:transposase [Bradyrhizobium sp. LB8.2]
MRCELGDYEWTATKPMLPNKSRGVRRVNDGRVLNGIFWVLRSGSPWRDLPPTYGPRTICYNRFVMQAPCWCTRTTELSINCTADSVSASAAFRIVRICRTMSPKLADFPKRPLNSENGSYGHSVMVQNMRGMQ